MPRQPEGEEVGVMDSLLGDGEGVNFGDGVSPTGPAPAPSEPPAPLERTAQGEEIREGVVQRVKPPTERPALRQEMTAKERAAIEASQVAPQRVFSEEDLTEIPGMPFVEVMKDALIGLVGKHGWEAIGTANMSEIAVNFPRLYRTLRFVVNGGIYGDRKVRGVTPTDLAARVG